MTNISLGNILSRVILSRGQGSFGPSTGGADLQGNLQPAELHVKHLTIGKLDNHLDKKFLKGTNRTFDSPFLLRQGEPGTSQYIDNRGESLTKNIYLLILRVPQRIDLGVLRQSHCLLINKESTQRVKGS